MVYYDLKQRLKFEGIEKLNREGNKTMQYINLNNKTILITGAAGFIGANLTLKLLSLYNNIIIIGIDNMNDYYDVSIKEWRLTQIEKRAKKQKASSWLFIKGSIADKELINRYSPNTNLIL